MLTASPKVVDVVVSSTQWSAEFIGYVSSTNSERAGYSVPVGSNAQAATLPWNNIDKIRIQFSEDVIVHKSDLSISGVNLSSYEVSSFIYDPQTYFATWTLANPLTKDRILLDLDGDGIDPVTNLTGARLDGNWLNNSATYASGDGNEGGDFEFAFNVLPGDGNNSNQVTVSDYVSANALSGKTTTSSGYNAKFDFDGSGQINSSDSLFVLGRIGNALPTGSPAGLYNDAPSAVSHLTLSVSNAAIDEVIELWNWFDDAESTASGLIYSITSNSNPELFDLLTINQASGEMTLSAASGVSGVARIGVKATDSAGNSTSSSIDVCINCDNQRPWLTLEAPQLREDETWLIYGTVSDDQVFDGETYVTFSGAVQGRAAVYPDGTFEFVTEWDPAQYALFEAVYHDSWDQVSNVPSRPIGNI